MTDDGVYCEHSLTVREEALQALISASMYALSYIIGREGNDALPIVPLAKALKSMGVQSKEIDEMVARKEGESHGPR